MSNSAHQIDNELSGLTAQQHEELRALLTASSSLSEDAIEKINQLMRTSNLDFSRAALQLGLITVVDIHDAIVRVRKIDAHANQTLIESALNRLSSRRYEIVVRENTPAQPNTKLIIAHDTYNNRNEKIRALRTELLLFCESSKQETNVIALVGAESGEGRSLLSAELAIAFSQLSRRTLLVDADFRSPQLHKLFNCDNRESGLAQALTTGDRPATHPVIGLPHLWLLTTGPVPSNPLELLSDSRFQVIAKNWRRNYEFVIIDTPAVNQYSDALPIATVASRVLVVTRAKHSTYAATKELMRRLETTQANILGAVINHF